jgi:DNA-binding SARP family transcriptional activator
MADNALVLAAILHDEAGERAARQTLQQLGVRDDATRIAGPRLAVRRRGVRPVAIRALGTFAVLVDDSPVPVSAWGSRKPRDALKVLVAGAGRRTTRDALSEALWPGQEDTGSRISVVLSTLRSVLDPEKTYEPDHFVLADRTTVRLNLEAVDLDTVAFESAAQQAMLVSEAGGAHDVASLVAAATAYTGDFLDEDHDQPWADATRERLAMLSREVRRRLGLRLSSTEPECAVPWLVGLLQDDPYDETCHLLLVATMLRLGRFGEARRAHRAYEAAMAELDVPAAPFVEVAGQVRAERSGRER